MADATASFLLTARDATAAAINSADKNLKRLQKTAASVKGLFATFGVVASGRMFAGWITHALDAKDITSETSEAIKDAKSALDAMRTSSSDLAVNLATSLVPAMKAVSAVLTGWNAIMLNADPAPFGKEIKDLTEDLENLKKQGVDTGIGYMIYSPAQQAQMAKYQADIDTLIEKQGKAFEQSGRLAIGLDSPLGEIDLARMRSELTGKNLRMDLPIAVQLKQVNWDAAFNQLQQDALQEIQFTPIELPVAMQLDQMPTKAEIDSVLYPVEQSFEELAGTLGTGLRASFTEFLTDSEFNFQDFLKRMAAEFLTSSLFSAFGKAFGGGTGFFASMFGGSRANEGPVSGGMVYKVHPGEAFFAPGQDGRVEHLAGAGGGNQTFYLTQNFAGGPTPDAARQGAELLRLARADAKYQNNRGRGGRR